LRSFLESEGEKFILGGEKRKKKKDKEEDQIWL
jgi:hypothetical protein